MMSPENSAERVGHMVPLRLRGLSDLARLVSGTMTMGHPTYIVHFVERGKHVYGVFIVFRDYYKHYGIPMFYYTVTDKELPGDYLLFRSDESGEYIEPYKGVKPGWVAIPVVHLKEKPRLIGELEVE
jgi:hypothetical protein